MERINQVLFQKVICFSYYAKENDGRFIEADFKNLEAEYVDTNYEKLDMECICDGSLEFIKTYYSEKQKRFSGVVVGFKDVVVTGYLVADISYDFMGNEFLRIYKQPKHIEKCAIVYYANNRKRLVPINRMEEL